MGCGSPLGSVPPQRAQPPEPPPPEKLAPHEERRPITAVFVDIVGSTSRAEQLDPEDVLALLEPYYARLRGVLELHGGIVEKFIGDAVVALFGAPVAHEDDPERAVRAGLAILTSIAELNAEDSSRKLEVRIGVTTGEAIVSLDARVDEGRGMAWGDVLNTAARLQSAAPVNGLIVDERTFRACPATIEFRDAPPVTAKGKAEPVPVWEAIGLRDVERKGVFESPLVGRENELAALADVWADVLRSGSPALAILVGEPGLGKTRLLSEVAERADGADVHWGGCLSYGEGITYWPITQIVKGAAGILASDSREVTSAKLDALIDTLPISDVDQLRTIASALANLVGAPTTPRGTYVTTDLSQAELHWGVRRVCELLATLQPLVLVFEDLHWAEPTLVELMESLLEVDAPVLVLASARPELAETHERLVEPGSNRTVIQLDALSETESESLVTQLVETLVDQGLDRPTIERLARTARGNPLFLEEMVQMLLDAGPLDAAALEALPTPDSLQALVAARLDSLPPPERQLAQHTSVAGLTFWSSAAARLDDRAESPDDLLGSLEHRSFVHEHDDSEVAGEREWEFKHMVVRDVAYGRLPKGRRVGLHVRFADWIAELPQGSEEFLEILAYHLEQSCLFARQVGRTEVPPPVERAIDALRRCGEKAELREGLREAHRFYTRALDLVADDDQTRRTELLLRRAHTLVGLGELRSARDQLEGITETADVLGRSDLRCDGLIALGNIAGRQGRSAEASELLSAAEKLAEGLNDPRLRIRAAYEAAWWDAYFAGDVDSAVEKLTRTLALAEAEGDLALRIGGHLRLGMLLVNVARLEEAEPVLAHCADLAGELGSVRDAARVTHQLGLIRLYRGELDSSAELLLQADEWLDRTGDGNFLIQNLRALAMHALACEQPVLAEQHSRRALPLALEYGGYFAIETMRLLVESLVRQGRLADAGEIAASALQDVAEEDAAALAAARTIEGTLACAAGDRVTVRRAFGVALEALAGAGFRIELGETHLAFGAALAALGDDGGARPELERAAEIFAEVGALGLLATATLRQAALAERPISTT
jgi:class 3 adenylate cyclase/tetratricopeptide (TPR) repeat protein